MVSKGASAAASRQFPRPAALALLLVWIASMDASGLQLVWFNRAGMPRAQAGGAAALFRSVMVVAGGTAWEGGAKLWLDDVQVYVSTEDKWRAGPRLSEPLAYGPFAQSEEALEIFGGTGSATGTSRTIWRLDSKLNGWTKAGETPSVHLLGRAARVGERVFLFGGCEDVADLTRCSNKVWMRERDGAAWREVAKLPGGAVALSAIAVLNGKVYLFGGCSMAEPGKLMNRAEAWAFDPRGFAFRKLRDLPVANRGLTAATLGGRIWLFGGYTAAPAEASGKGPEFGFTNAVWSYDPARDSYASESPLPAAMTSLEMLTLGNTMLGAGGEDRMRGRSGRTFRATLGVVQ